MQHIIVEESVNLEVTCGHINKYVLHWVALDLVLNILCKLSFYFSGVVALRIDGQISRGFYCEIVCVIGFLGSSIWCVM